MLHHNEQLRRQVIKFCQDYGFDSVQEDENFIFIEDTKELNPCLEIDINLLLGIPVNELYGFLVSEITKFKH